MRAIPTPRVGAPASLAVPAAGTFQATSPYILGHYDAGFTLRTYAHTTRQMQAAETMSSFMAQVM